MTWRGGGEMDLNRMGHTSHLWTATGGRGAQRRSNGCIALEETIWRRGLSCKRVTLGGGKVLYETAVVIGRASPAIACLSNVP